MLRVVGLCGGVMQQGRDTVHDVHFSVDEGACMAVLGPSGCGKTTMLKLIAGLLRPRAGAVFVDARDVTHDAPERRRIGMVFQSPLLFPHMNCVQNVAYPLRMHGVRDASKKAQEALEAFGMGALAHRYAHELSGGQQQRVALARAFCVRPRVLLLDEPFGALDTPVRMDMRALFQDLCRVHRMTSVFVTHDREEAMTLGHVVATVRAGTIDALGTPQQLYDAPPTVHTAQLMGETNVFPVDAQMTWVIRPHHVRIVRSGCDDVRTSIPFETACGIVTHVVYVEGRYRCALRVGGQSMTAYTDVSIPIGERVTVCTNKKDWVATRSYINRYGGVIDEEKNSVDDRGALRRHRSVRTLVARVAECVRPRRR